MTLEYLKRFWSKVAIAGPDQCWDWQAGVSMGYGMHLRPNEEGRRHDRAHRISWETAHGPVPKGLFVLHTCDNRLCVNPAHLYAGTHQDNIADAVARGRYQRPSVYVTHCRHGHEFTKDNTAISQRMGIVRRTCRACRARYKRAKANPEAGRRGRPWTDAEDRAVLDRGVTDREIAAALGRSEIAVSLRRMRLMRCSQELDADMATAAVTDAFARVLKAKENGQ